MKIYLRHWARSIWMAARAHFRFSTLLEVISSFQYLYYKAWHLCNRLTCIYCTIWYVIYLFWSCNFKWTLVALFMCEQYASICAVFWFIFRIFFNLYSKILIVLWFLIKHCNIYFCTFELSYSLYQDFNVKAKKLYKKLYFYPCCLFVFLTYKSLLYQMDFLIFFTL